MACAMTLSKRSVIDFWPQEEPSRAYTQATQWPRYGGCVVASARTHARSWRGKTGQPEWDLGPHSQAIKGPHEYYCALLSKSPQLFTKGWPTHTKNIAAKWWRRLQQLPLFSLRKATAQSLRSAGLPQFCANCVIRPKDFYFYLIQAVLVWQAANQSAGQSPFSWHDLHRPHYPRKSVFTRLYCQPKNATILSNKGAA